MCRWGDRTQDVTGRRGDTGTKVMSGKRWGRSRTGGADLPKRSMYENAARKPAAQ